MEKRQNFALFHAPRERERAHTVLEQCPRNAVRFVTLGQHRGVVPRQGRLRYMQGQLLAVLPHRRERFAEIVHSLEVDLVVRAVELDGAERFGENLHQILYGGALVEATGLHGCSHRLPALFVCSARGRRALGRGRGLR